jgi:hypothetical protein
MSDFIQQCLAHEAGYGDIDDFIDQWHRAPEGKSVCDFLGMTRQEYALWVVDASVLPAIVKAHAQNMTLDEIFKEGAPKLYFSETPTARDLIHWLKNSQLWERRSVE